MTGQMHHMPCDVIRQLIINLDLGTDPDDDLAWPVYAAHLPEMPDNAVCVYDTQGRQFGRDHNSGTTLENYGIQILVRCNNVVDGYKKAKNIMLALDNDVARDEVELEDDTYLVHAVTRTGPVNKAGLDGRRWMHSLSSLASITMTVIGTGD